MKTTYIQPEVTVAQVALTGLICTSPAAAPTMDLNPIPGNDQW